METKTEKLGHKAIRKFTKCITDQLFIFIQQDEELFKEYLDAATESTTQGVNSVLGKMITEAYHLENVGVEAAPKSQLLKKYTRHTVSKKGITDDVPEMLKGDNLFAPKYMTPAKKAKEKPKKKVQQKKPVNYIEETHLFDLE